MNDRQRLFTHVAKGRCQCTAYRCHGERESRCNKKLTIGFVAYKVPLEMGGREHIVNMIALCSACYSRKVERDSFNVGVWRASQRQGNEGDV